MKNLYLYVDLGAFIIPFLFSFHPKLAFYKKWRFLFPAIILSAIPFLAWDIYFTSAGVWGFNDQYISGVKITNLPLEEVLFFICIPYSCVFTYHCFSILISRDIFFRVSKSITCSLIILLLIGGFFFWDRMYTAVTCISLSVILIILWQRKLPVWMSKFYFTYLVLLIPFTIVNGILTGTGLDEPVVWYNNSENANIRILSIPVEDIFYGMMLILLNVLFYEYFKKRRDSEEEENSRLSF